VKTAMVEFTSRVSRYTVLTRYQISKYYSPMIATILNTTSQAIGIGQQKNKIDHEHGSQHRWRHQPPNEDSQEESNCVYAFLRLCNRFYITVINILCSIIYCHCSIYFVFPNSIECRFLCIFGCYYSFFSKIGFAI